MSFLFQVTKNHVRKIVQKPARSIQPILVFRCSWNGVRWIVRIPRIWVTSRPVTRPHAESPVFPSTRYQGSKARSAAWIVERLDVYGCETALDAFGGTGAVAWRLKQAGLAVTFNDALEWNRQVGLALIANDRETVDPRIASAIGTLRKGRSYGSFIARTFGGIYYTDAENAWLDVAIQNIDAEHAGHARSLLLFALFQACLVKRPYNLFHRANLAMRLRRVPRSFGNKVTWERPFDELMPRYLGEANRAVFRGRRRCKAIRKDVLDVPAGLDLVYLDPPYVPARGPGVDYLDFYHFLEGLSRYDEWPDRIDRSSPRRGMPAQDTISGWADRRRIANLLETVFDLHRHSILALSYRNDGVPSADELMQMLKRHKRKVEVHERPCSPYALSKRNSRELLLIGTD